MQILSFVLSEDPPSYNSFPPMVCSCFTVSSSSVETVLWKSVPWSIAVPPGLLRVYSATASQASPLPPPKAPLSPPPPTPPPSPTTPPSPALPPPSTPSLTSPPQYLHLYNTLLLPLSPTSPTPSPPLTSPTSNTSNTTFTNISTTSPPPLPSPPPTHFTLCECKETFWDSVKFCDTGNLCILVQEQHCSQCSSRQKWMDTWQKMDR